MTARKRHANRVYRRDVRQRVHQLVDYEAFDITPRATFSFWDVM